MISTHAAAVLLQSHVSACDCFQCKKWTTKTKNKKCRSQNNVSHIIRVNTIFARKGMRTRSQAADEEAVSCAQALGRGCLARKQAVRVWVRGRIITHSTENSCSSYPTSVASTPYDKEATIASSITSSTCLEASPWHYY